VDGPTWGITGPVRFRLTRCGDLWRQKGIAELEECGAIGRRDVLKSIHQIFKKNENENDSIVRTGRRRIASRFSRLNAPVRVISWLILIQSGGTLDALLILYGGQTLTKGKIPRLAMQSKTEEGYQASLNIHRESDHI